MPDRSRELLAQPGLGLLVLALALAVSAVAPPSALANDGCEDPGWSESRSAARGDDSGLGGTGIVGDDSGIGGTGLTGDDSGIGGTGIFGTITSRGSICVNGLRVHPSEDVVVVFEAGSAIGSASLAVGQTVWLVARHGEEGLETDQVWVLPASVQPQEWLEQQIRTAGTLAALSVEGPVDGWVDPERFEVVGVLVAATARDLRPVVDSASQVRVSGSFSRDGVLRADRIAVTARPPVRPVRPTDRPPRIDRPPTNDRPVRPDSSLRPNRTDRLDTAP
jgi:hypothetical protein